MKKESTIYALVAFAAIAAVVAAIAFDDVTVRVTAGAICALISAICCRAALLETMTRQQTNKSEREQLQLENMKQFDQSFEQMISTFKQMFSDLDEKSGQRLNTIGAGVAAVQSANEKVMEQLQSESAELLSTLRSISDNLGALIQSNTLKTEESAASIVEQSGIIWKSIETVGNSLTGHMDTVRQLTEEVTTNIVSATQEAGKQISNTIDTKDQLVIETLCSGNEKVSRQIEDNTQKIEESAVELLNGYDEIQKYIRKVAESLDEMKTIVDEVSRTQENGWTMEKNTCGKIVESISDMESAVKDVTRAVEHMEETAERQVESYDNIMQNYAHITAQDAKLIERVFQFG